jgi:cytochrome c peroxidase
MALSGCFNDSSSSSSLDNDLAGAIESQGLTGDASANRTLPAVTDPKFRLGMDLFFTKALGGDQDSACVTCHHPALGGGDKLSLPIGVHSDNPDLLGPGRSLGGGFNPNVPRNAPTTFNIALWDEVLFHDGRVEALDKQPGQSGAVGGIRTPDTGFGLADPAAGANLMTAQARFPVTSAEEMRGFVFEAGNDNAAVRSHLAERLSGVVAELADPDTDNSGVNDWQERFETVYGAGTPLITFDRVTDAIASYEASQVFVENPWKAYVQGDEDALTETQKEGALLFFSAVEDGGAGCASCHSGDFFSDEKFHNTAMVQIGPGKGDGDGTDDFGRFRETGETSDRYAFRTPTLLNVEHTGPYGHAGAYDSLEGVIRHHLNAANAIDDYFASSGTWCQKLQQFSGVEDCDVLYPSAESNTRSALAELESARAAGTAKLENVTLSDSQVADLVAFMGALTDPCLENASCIGKWIPDTSTDGPAGGQVNAVDRNLQPLKVNN